ncbi:S41 family peptidase [Streptosporangium sandarakinum]|uniref:S41 family peptidase n=1 Tax=Streptosporangium sandarakinum TaxID=1260955 RepID=UPI003427D74C
MVPVSAASLAAVTGVEAEGVGDDRGGAVLDERTHLNTMYRRGGERSERSWSLPHVPGARFGGGKPLYVLSGDSTFSAAEEPAYDLQQFGRAVVVGEPTRGGAHPCKGWTVHPHLEAAVPTGRAVNPVSGANWEGIGVQPDIPCAAAESLDRAHALTLGPCPSPGRCHHAPTMIQ